MNLDFIKKQPIAHRGLHNAELNIVENSRGSIEAAIIHGYTIEIDVQLTKDNQAIVFHDETLDRMTEISGNVVDFTLPELLTMTYKANGENIISYAELLKIVDGKVPLVVEVKSLSNNIGPLEAHVARGIASYKGDVCIMSFNPFTVREFKRIAPQIVRGIVAEYNMLPHEWPGTNAVLRFLFKNLLHWPLTRPHFISYHVHDLPRICVKIAKALGVPIITWTVKSPAAIAVLPIESAQPLPESDLSKAIQIASNQVVEPVNVVVATPKPIAPQTVPNSLSPQVAAAGAYGVQLAALPSEASARLAFSTISRQFPSILSGYTPIIREAIIPGKGTFYRVFAGPIASYSDANQVCANLRAAGGDCLAKKM